MNLLLVQHAEAAPKSEDPARPLTAAGRDAAARVARWLAGIDRPAEIRHSTKLRARQTAEEIAAAWGVTAREVEGLAPRDDVAPLARALERESGDLMLVGHLPQLGRLASLLVAGDAEAAVVAFRPAGVVCLTRGDDGGWSVAWMVVPGLLVE